MASYQKVVVLPLEAEKSATVSEENKKKVVRDKPHDKILQIIKIILKIAKINGYDVNGYIKGLDGNFLPNTDIARLTVQSMTPGRVILGEDEFIRILHEANVYPEEIVNDHYKAKLSRLYNNVVSPPPITHEAPPQVTQVKPMEFTETSRKRKYDEMPVLKPADTQSYETYNREPENEEENDLPSKKRKASDYWELPSDDDNW